MNRGAVLVFAAACAVLVSLLAFPAALDVDRNMTSRLVAVTPIAVALALMGWATYVRIRLRERVRSRS